MNLMRSIELEKFDHICAYILEVIEVYTNRSKEEIEKLKDS